MTTVNSLPLQTSTVVQVMVQMHNGAGTTQSHAIIFIVANNAQNDMVISLEQLQKHNYDIY
jgi:hypothetical protein